LCISEIQPDGFAVGDEVINVKSAFVQKRAVAERVGVFAEKPDLYAGQ